MLHITDSDLQRFSSKVQFPSAQEYETACWIWQGAHHSKNRGYGKFHLAGRTMNAHKAAYLMFNGDVEDGQVIGHICNNERCCNPHHLVAQSQSDNIKYSVICGRHNSQH